ncbi:glycosyltransferase family 2 protein [Niabella hibiscisoli]|uniref:glycosyltransferase family 2 protein n=1 Tax=Niabella hibiscisoli TaxID=1825928 RepID=UPI001F104F4B|nr:glycosyltransferase family 2 protein [Niabella hibiscisoli]MCH5719948.1 glycosyltransferase family 2 protein [Niabella hibiscisoli]
MITVFTPSYNRAHLLKQLWYSLKAQTDKRLEWVIVDDGSSDDTVRVVSEMVSKETDFHIHFYQQKNQGKHIAINTGLSIATYELFFIVDSDDKLPPNCIQLILSKYPQVRFNDKIAGIVGRKAHFNSQLIGSDFYYKDFVANSFDFRYRFKLKGDMAEVFKTDIFKKFPFPKFQDEKFCPEALVFNRIARNFEMLWTSDIYYNAEYLEGGLSARIYEVRKKAPQGSALFYEELSKSLIPFEIKCKAIINYWRFARFLSDTLLYKARRVNIMLSILLLPIIFVACLKDNLKK